jgi:hypothetical protein
MEGLCSSSHPVVIWCATFKNVPMGTPKGKNSKGRRGIVCKDALVSAMYPSAGADVWQPNVLSRVFAGMGKDWLPLLHELTVM